MIKIISVFLLSILIFPSSCKSNQGETKDKEILMVNKANDSTVHEIKNERGRVIERWGNYHTDDNNMNFRHYYYYDKTGMLLNEKQYWFDEKNIDCLVKDTAEYRDIYYYYIFENGKYVLAQRKCYDRNYDSDGKFIGRKLYYIFDVIQDKFIFRDDSMGK